MMIGIYGQIDNRKGESYARIIISNHDAHRHFIRWWYCIVFDTTLKVESRRG